MEKSSVHGGEKEEEIRVLKVLHLQVNLLKFFILPLKLLCT